MKQFAVLALLGAFLTTPAYAETEPEDVVKYRQSIYQVMVWQFQNLKGMLGGDMEYSAEDVAQAARYLAAATPMLDGAYAKGSITDDSDALEKIWEEWDEFSALLDRLQRETATLATVSAEGDRSAITEQFMTVGGVCKDCHDQYKD